MMLASTKLLATWSTEKLSFWNGVNCHSHDKSPPPLSESLLLLPPPPPPPFPPSPSAARGCRRARCTRGRVHRALLSADIVAQ
jgi:hypothetical protein